MFPLRLLRHLDLAQQVLDLLTYCGEGLQTYTQQTGFVAIAIPDLPLPEDAAAWGIDTALNIARRAEQALSDVPAEEADWERVQRELGRDLTELQSTMSTQGHAATAEPNDHGLIVRIVIIRNQSAPTRLSEGSMRNWQNSA
jgi:hypothetical protein